jgi:hypothetical protein
MAAPVLVRGYVNDTFSRARTRGQRPQALPPIASFAFADILREADGPDFQSAIDGIAEICAKNRMSLADEYGSHMPPQGTITAATSSHVKPQLLRPGMRRALTSVPEASSGSSEGSHRSKKKRKGIFSFGKRQDEETNALRTIRIGSMGRSISVGGTTALAEDQMILSSRNDGEDTAAIPQPQRRSSQAASSLQRLLSACRPMDQG